MACARIGAGTYGVVLTGVESTRPTECVKTFKHGHQIKLLRALMLIRHLDRVGDDAFVSTHFSFGTGSVCWVENIPGLVMPRHRIDLHHWVECQGALGSADVRLLHKELGTAITWLNSVGVWWCDCSPSNVLLGFDGHWRASDSDLWRGAMDGVPVHTAYTVCMRSPELLLGFDVVSLAPSELWALGITVDFAARGCYAVESEAPWATLIEHLAGYDDDIPPFIMENLGACVPGKLPQTHDWWVYSSLLRLDPQQRVFYCDDMPSVYPNPPEAPMFRVAREIDTDRRARVIECLEHHHVPMRVLLVAIVWLDATLGEHFQPDVDPELLAGALLVLAHGLLLENIIFDDPVPPEFDNLVTKLMWINHSEFPLGLDMWSHISEENVRHLINDPNSFYSLWEI